jgi:tetratricopeptide (TPR) repeat protein
MQREQKVRFVPSTPALIALLISLCGVMGGCSIREHFPHFQKRKMLSVFHLIETEKFQDARRVIEEMVEDEDSKEWSRLWYARGMLAQNAYREGRAKNNRTWMTLYPDQLYVAWESYERSLSLDREGRTERALAPRYILLANEFQRLGGEHYKAGRHQEAHRAFEQSLTITGSPFLAVQVDSGLIYNTSLAAYASGDHDRAAFHLSRLHGMHYSPDATHLLATVHLIQGDTNAAMVVLREGVMWFPAQEVLILMLADLKVSRGDTNAALQLLSASAQADTANHRYPYTLGLVYQRTGEYPRAIAAYEEAYRLSPDDAGIPLLIAMCYYNSGVEIDEYTRTLSNRSRVVEEKRKSAEAFRSANLWLQRAMSHQSTDRELLMRLQELHQALRMPEKGGADFGPNNR